MLQQALCELLAEQKSGVIKAGTTDVLSVRI